jgi:hypothetical protein
VSPPSRAARARRLLVAGLLALASPARADGDSIQLRYGWAAGQVWHATHTTTRETHVGDGVSREQGLARFEYQVKPGESPGTLKLEARLLSQRTAAGSSPLDFSPIAFRARVDARRLAAPYYEIADATAPGPGQLSDPIALRRVLRQIASGWRDAVLWFPELPERALDPGERFVVSESHDLSDTPGLAMRIQRTRTYTLLDVREGVARFRVEDASHVDAAGAEAGIASEERAEGEARFDLALGMWQQQQLSSSQRAVISGAPPEARAGEASSRSITEIRMERTAPGAAR